MHLVIFACAHARVIVTLNAAGTKLRRQANDRVMPGSRSGHLSGKLFIWAVCSFAMLIVEAQDCWHGQHLKEILPYFLQTAELRLCIGFGKLAIEMLELLAGGSLALQAIILSASLFRRIPEEEEGQGERISPSSAPQEKTLALPDGQVMAPGLISDSYLGCNVQDRD